MQILAQRWPLILCFLLPLLYVIGLENDPISGLFGLLWSDEGVYLLAAKNQVLFGRTQIFPGDAYEPQFTVPLLHQFGMLVMTKWNTVWPVRFGMGVAVLTAHFIIARLAAKYHGNRNAGIACFLILTLTPTLFFYGRLGLSEGLQYFLMATNLWALYRLWNAEKPVHAVGFASLSAALVVAIVLSKITAVSISIALMVGTLAAICLNPHIRRVRIQVILLSGLAGLATIGALYLWWIQGHEDVWRTNNFGNRAYYENVPHDLAYAFHRIKHHFIGLQYFLVLMPFFALAFAGLMMAADRSRGYLWLLWLITVVTIAVEMFFGGELRRSFFELAMMMVLAGFTVGEYVTNGFRDLRWTKSRIISALIVFAFILGAVHFVTQAIMVKDLFYMVLGPTWMVLLALALLVQGPDSSLARRFVVGVVSFMALIPMTYQATMAPRSINASIMAMEKIIPEDAYVTGFILPWPFLGLKRQIIFTNCRSANYDIANDFSNVPTEGRFFHLGLDDGTMQDLQCIPLDYRDYENILAINIFYPFNKGPGFGGSRNWVLRLRMHLFERITDGTIMRSLGDPRTVGAVPRPAN